MIKILKKIYKAFVPERLRISLYHNFIFKIKAPFYFGTNLTCNCCMKSFRKFLTFGVNPRRNAACPNCHSLERTRFLLMYLQNETRFFKDKLKVLHFAPEYTLEKRFKKMETLDYVSADINQALAMIRVDITDISFPDNTFDVIFCSHVLMHIKDEAKAISELYRVLKPGGVALIQTQTDTGLEKTFETVKTETAKERLEAYGDELIFRIHGKDFPDRLANAGFKTKEVVCKNHVPGQVRKRYGLLEDDIIFEASK